MMPDYRLKTRAVSKDSFKQLCDEMKIFADHVAPHAAQISAPRFVSGYFTITCDVAIPVIWLDHLNMEVAP